MTAVDDAALLLGAFRAAAHRQASLTELVTFLDASVRWDVAADLAEPGETDESDETFITATVLEIPDHDSRIHMIDCGHPPPVVLREGRAMTLDADQCGASARPGRAGARGPSRRHVQVRGGRPPAAVHGRRQRGPRQPSGTFYPLTERIAGWTETDPETFLRRLRRDLLHHVGGRLGDDAALIAIERPRTAQA